MRQILFLTFIYLLFPILGTIQINYCQQLTKEHTFIPAGKETTYSLWNCSESGRQLIKWGLWALVFAFVGVIPLMGIPGFILILCFDFLRLLPREFKEYVLWTDAMEASVLWPMGIPIGFMLDQFGKLYVIPILVDYGFFIGLIVWILGIGYYLGYGR